MRRSWLALLGPTIVGLTPFVAAAQTVAEPCPDVAAPTAGDALAAAEQALCWYERDREGASECVATRPGSSACVAHAARWCDQADLDVNPQVPNACFLARVREGQLDEAARIAPLLTEAWREVEPCRAAVMEGITVQVSTAPAGGVIHSGAQRVGETRAQIRLLAPFWRQSLSVAFGDVRVDVTPETLVESFDPRACTMRPIRVDRPAGAVDPAPVAPRRPRTRPRRERTTGISVPGLIVGAGGVVLVGAASVLLVVAESTASDLRERPDGTTWSAALQSDYDSVAPTRVAGGVLLGVGAISIGVGALLLALDGERDPSTDRRSAGWLRVGFAGDRLVLSGEL